jgi:hypothetical protein
MTERRRTQRSILRHAAVFALFLLLSIVLTWPLAIRLDTAVSDLGDPLLVTWILDWTSHALLHQPLSLFQAPMYHPAPLTLAYSEHLTGIALFVLPFHVAGLEPIAVYNIAMLLSFALSGYGAFVLARMVTPRTSVPSFSASLIAGIFFAFVSFKFDHLAHLQNIASGWLPLILAGMIAYWREPSRRNAGLFAAAFVMNGLTNVYYLLFVSVAIAFTVLFLLTAAPRRDRAFWLRAFGALAIAGLVLLPFLLPYRAVSKMYNLKREVHEVFTTGWRAWLVTTNRNWLYGRLGTGTEWQVTENQLFPGLLALFLTGAAIVLSPRQVVNQKPEIRNQKRILRVLDVLVISSALLSILSLMTPRFAITLGRPLLAIRGPDIPIMVLIVVTLLRLSIRMPRTMGGEDGSALRDVIARSRFPVEVWMAAVWFFVGFLGSFGFRSFLFSFLFRRVSVFQSIRAAPRFAVIAYVGLTVFVALGAWLLITRRRYLAPVLVALMIVEVIPTVQWEQALSQRTPLARWLAEKKVGPIAEMPVEPWYIFRYLLAQTHHRVPMLNGTSGFEPPAHRDLRVAWEKREYENVLKNVEENGAKLFVTHAHWLSPEHQQPLRDFLRGAVDAGRLRFMQRFDHGVEGDFVFAVARNYPNAPSPPELPDPQGLMPRAMLERFFRNETTHTNVTFGVLEQPGWDAVVTGPLTVNGWVLSPHGTPHVWILIDEGRHRFETIRVPRPDVNARYGWYYDAKPGFTITLARPKGVPRKTDVQIEVEDGAGRKTRLDDVLFVWE